MAWVGLGRLAQDGPALPAWRFRSYLYLYYCSIRVSESVPGPHEQPIPLPMDNSKPFREELAIQYPTLGRPLWEPDPGGYNAVQVGDVGFIRHGYFYCLFNALHPRDNPSDHSSESDPHYPQPLQPRTSNHIRTSIDHRKDFRSKNVTNVSRGANIDALG